MKNFLCKNKYYLYRLLSFVFFLLLLFFVFSRVTYLFRNAGPDRLTVVGLKEENNKLDVIYIGGSAAFVYWEPLKAYKDCGIASYDLATNAVGAENLLTYIKYAQKYQNPDLYVIDIRAFQYYSDDVDFNTDAGMRNASDSLNINFLPRYELINSYLHNRDVDADKLSYFIDIAKYHTNIANLKTPDAWGYIDNTGINYYKGCELPVSWVFMEEPEDFKTDERKALLPNAQKELHKILKYCDDKKLNVLFVVCPYVISEEDYAIYNTVADEVMAHGYDYLNMNDYLSEMEIDYATDFYNVNHVNVYGADKYTEFLEKYMLSHYGLKDHREDSEYADWERLAGIFEEYSNSTKAGIDKIVSDAKNAAAQREDIQKTVDFSKWSKYVGDPHYSLLVAGDGKSVMTDAATDTKSLENLEFNLGDLFDNPSYKNIVHNLYDLEPSQLENDILQSAVGRNEANLPAIIGEDNSCSIKIDDKEYSRKDPEGLNIVVFDNYFRTVLDSVTLKQENGHIVVER